MNENIRITEVSADADGTLGRQTFGFFDLSSATDDKNLKKLLVANIAKEVKNVSAVWERSIYKPVVTETEIIPPRYFGDSIRFYWSRSFSEREARAAVEDESALALECAIDAVVSAGYKIMNYPSSA